METIGKYRIEEKIGSGGFGEVFRAYDPFIKRHVAIKTCDSDDQTVADRFYQEAEIGGNLHHRNITTVYDFGVQDGLPYLIQEYLSGEDLDAKIKRRDYLPYSEKLLYLLQIARGLAYAHAKGYIHRDVKPANVRILEDGTAKIMDFGIAKLAQQESGLTQTGMTLGTAAYLSPEQVKGERVDVRTDIFSFGILAYELLTYQRPFEGEQISTVIYNLLNHEPEPITAYWPGAPPELVALVDRCLRKDASLRFADGNQLARELEKLKRRGRGGPTPGRPTAPATPPANPTTSAPVAPAPAATTATATVPMETVQPATATAPTADQGQDSAVDGLRPRTEPEPGPSAEVAPDGADHAPRSNFGGLIILIALAAVAAAGGWWLGMRGATGDGKTAPPPAQSSESIASTSSETAALQPEISGQAENSIVETGDDDQETVTPETATPETAPPAPAPTEPAPPAAPAKGRLVLPKVSWTDRMTVRIDGKTYGLYREHRIQMPPGTYRAVFELASDGPASDYRPASRSAEVRVVAGESSRVAVPIPQPGAFSVRPLPGRPQGQVSLDGTSLGLTPLSKIQRAPGTYVLEILPRDGEGEGLREEITLTGGEEIILSFDLDAGTLRTRTKAHQSPPP